MRFPRIAPKRFSTRVIGITLIAGLIPLLFFFLVIQLFIHRFPDETSHTIRQGQEEQLRRSEWVIRDMAEDFIRQKAMDVVLQLELYLEARPGMTVADLQADQDFREIALQPVGRTGYTSVLDSETAACLFHRDPRVENVSPQSLSEKLPEFYAIAESSMGGRYARGFYTWENPDGNAIEKFMYIAPLSSRTADGVRFSVVASTGVDEFTSPIRAAQDVYRSTARYMEITLNRLIRSFTHTGVFIAGGGILLILGFAVWMGVYLSRSIVLLREATRAINQGDFTVRVKQTGSGDVAELMEDFNRMAETLSATTVKKQALEASEEELKKTNIRLQEEIAEHKQAEERISQSLGEKENLLAEIHHRVKNNLQVISSLLALQSGHIADERALSLVRNCEDRIRSMALAHEKLYLSEDLSRIDFSNYVKIMAARLFQVYGVDSRCVTFSSHVEDVLFTIETAIPLGLIINELLSNTLKYAFPEGRNGEITVRLDADEETGGYTLVVADDGIGLPEGIDSRSPETFGLQLVNILVEQLGGTMTLDREGRTSFRITFSEQRYKRRI
ncbi:MAG: HAMP domain-containing protein [Deltaproteobacteria bacterium]|nr:HAMP domain-containing protein [Deltaproteobacteria bacterium]